MALQYSAANEVNFYFGYDGFSFLSGESALRSKWREIQATPLSFQRCIVLGTLVHCCTGT